MEGKFFVNPGSATGAVSWNADVELDSDGEAVSTPSFVLMDVSGDILSPQIHPEANLASNRSKETCLCYTYTSCARMPTVWKTLGLRRSHSERTPHNFGFSRHYTTNRSFPCS